MKNKALIVFAIIVVFVSLVSWNTNNIQEQSESSEIQSRSELNTSNAMLLYAQASKIEQDVRRQNEMDNGIAANVVARVLTGEGITDAERIASTFAQIGIGACIAPIGILFAIAFLYRRSKPKVYTFQGKEIQIYDEEYYK